MESDGLSRVDSIWNSFLSTKGNHQAEKIEVGYSEP